MINVAVEKIMNGFKDDCEKPLGLSVAPKYYMGESYMPSRFVSGYGNISPWQEVNEVKDLDKFLAITKSMNGYVDLDGWIYVYIDNFEFGGTGAPCKAVRERVGARSEFLKIDEGFLSHFKSRNKSKKRGGQL